MLCKMVLHKVITTWPVICKRNFGVSSVVMLKAADPIQQLFVEKLQEYARNSSKPTFLDENPHLKTEIADEKKRILNVYGAVKPEDMNVFPALKFKELEVDPQKPMIDPSLIKEEPFTPTEVPE